MSAYSNQRAPGREHIPVFPKGFIAIRIIQLVLGVVVIGLSAFGLSILSFDGAALNIFTGVATMICCIYFIVAEYGPANLYNYWAILSLDIFLIVMWLASFALMASEVAPYMKAYSSYYAYDSSYYYSSIYSTDYSALGIFLACMAAVAGVGGLEFLLFVISLAITSVMLHRHRAAGLHCMPGSHLEKSTATTTPQAAAPQPTYAAQPMYAQAQPQVYAMPQQQAAYAYPQQTPSPLVAQNTGASYTQVQPQPVYHQQ